MKMFNVKITFIGLVLVLMGIDLMGQSCTDNRYIDDIFSNYDLANNVYFGTAPDYDVSEALTLDQDLTMDIYMPQGDALTKRPCIVMNFGGAFLAGWKEFPPLVDYCEAMVAKGYVVVSAQYRIGFNALNQASAVRAVYRGGQDMKAAIRFVKANAATYGVDTTMIFAGGHSAGAINALHASFVEEYERASNPLLADTYVVPQLLVDWPDLGCIECGANNLGQPPSNHVGKPVAIINMWGAIGDDSFIEPTTDNVPIISFHGDADNIVNPGYAAPFGASALFPALYGSIPIHDRMNALGYTNELHLYAGEGHELWDDPVIADDLVVKSADFLFENLLKPADPTVTGVNAVCPNSTETYSIVSPDPTETYCWAVTGGSIVVDNGTNIVVNWGSTGTGTVSVRAVSCNEAEGDIVAYNVNISAPSAPNGLASTFATEDEVVLSWNNTSSLSGLSYEVQYREVGAFSWTTAPSSGTALSVTGLDACKDYEFRVRALCGAYSGFSSIITETTDCIRVFAKVWLEGADDGSGSMVTDLNAASLLPSAQPYAASPWNYGGAETYSAWPSNAVDWVMVEVRDGANTFNVLAEQAAWIDNAGNIYGVDGNLGVEMSTLHQVGNHYIAVRHRNHLDVMSATTVGLPNTGAAYDFTTTAAAAMGNTQTLSASSKYAMYAGDFEGDGVINVDDFNYYLGETSVVIDYIACDTNLDTHCTVHDYDLYRKNASQMSILELRY